MSKGSLEVLKRKVSRREFLRGAAKVGGVVSVGLLSGCEFSNLVGAGRGVEQGRGQCIEIEVGRAEQDDRYTVFLAKVDTMVENGLVPGQGELHSKDRLVFTPRPDEGEAIVIRYPNIGVSDGKGKSGEKGLKIYLQRAEDTNPYALEDSDTEGLVVHVEGSKNLLYPFGVYAQREEGIFSVNIGNKDIPILTPVAESKDFYGFYTPANVVENRFGAKDMLDFSVYSSRPVWEK